MKFQIIQNTLHLGLVSCIRSSTLKHCHNLIINNINDIVLFTYLWTHKQRIKKQIAFQDVRWRVSAGDLVRSASYEGRRLNPRSGISSLPKHQRGCEEQSNIQGRKVTLQRNGCYYDGRLFRGSDSTRHQSVFSNCQNRC